jgi:CheY-like chemotaxis protein/HPt (histidine-containing phosphotransfer) domain-containing protein
MRVLAVDDHAAFRETLRDQLAGWGMDVDMAANGAEAMHKLTAAAREGRPYRVAVVDLLMPGMGGDSVASAVRADPGLSQTALLMVTSMDNPFDPAALHRLGFAACLTKPVRHSQLLDAVLGAVVRSDGPTEDAPRRIAGAYDAPSVCATASAAAGTAAPRELGGVRVLLAEDNEVNQEVARELLADAGCRVEIVSNGALALSAVQAHLREHRYDVVLMDCQMPELDGFQAAARVRELERGRESAGAAARLPIIALTANAVEGDRERCLAAGMDGYVTKPIDPDVLIEAVRSILASPRSAAAADHTAGMAAAAEHCSDRRLGEPTGEAQQCLVDAAASADLPIDAESLLRRCRGKGALAERILTQFEQQLAGQVETLRDSLERRDGEVLARLAHSIKGAAANMSASQLSDAAGSLERLGTAADFDAAAACLDQLADLAQQCRVFVPVAVARVRELSSQAGQAPGLI